MKIYYNFNFNMKIYFLRHEERYKSMSFFTPLTIEGKYNSIDLSDKIKSLGITHIYSSPFIRVLQTIEPFLIENDIQVNIENSLREINLLKGIPEKESKIELPEELYKQFRINKDYESKLKTENIIYPETYSNARNRFLDFLRDLINTNHTTDNNILLCSHAGLIMELINKLKQKPEYEFLNNLKMYPTGKITEIVDSKTLSFYPINWKIE